LSENSETGQVEIQQPLLFTRSAKGVAIPLEGGGLIVKGGEQGKKPMTSHQGKSERADKRGINVIMQQKGSSHNGDVSIKLCP
jgi:hypothetical protein